MRCNFSELFKSFFFCLCTPTKHHKYYFLARGKLFKRFFLSRNSFFIEQNLSGKTKRVLLEQQQQEEKSVSIFHMTIARI